MGTSFGRIHFLSPFIYTIWMSFIELDWHKIVAATREMGWKYFHRQTTFQGATIHL